MQKTTLPTNLSVVRWPGLAPRLLGDSGIDYPTYLHSGGYQRLDDSDALVEMVSRSGLLGRGVLRFLSQSRSARFATTGSEPAARSLLPTAKKANRRRSRIAGCSVTVRI